MKYLNYTALDFTTDEDFIKWVQHPTEEDDIWWRSYLQENPWQLATVNEARELVLHLSADLYPTSEVALEAVWEQLSHARQHYQNFGEEASGDIVFPKPEKNKYRFLWAAAAAVVLLMNCYLLFQPRADTFTYATAVGERMHLRLPDSSTVVLNGDSRLEVPAKWPKSKARVVELQGQAFFNVTHQHNQQQFLVKTDDGLQVEVLGTEFSVSSRGQQKQVILENGKVSLTMENQGKEVALEMAPGELVEVTGGNSITKKKVRTELYTAWKSTHLALENKTLEEVAQLLHHSYGYTVAIPDPALRQQRITAYLNDNTPHHILATLSGTLDVEIEKQHKQITISSN